jgi:Carboxypeptidase regulatory-like domain/TonB dependent receptor
MNKRHARALLTVVIAIAVVIPASAQTTGATLQGTVADEQGAVLPGATVTVVNVETGWSREAVTDTRGWYRAAALPPGRYEIRTSLQGFVTLVRAGLVLTLGQEATVNLSLSLASVAETVTVTADSPLVETTSNAIERTITRTDLDTLPLAGRNFANLATLSPGVAGVGGGGVSAGGQTTRSNSFIIDGTSNDDTVVNTQRGGFSLEAVREFAVITNQFSAEYGMASGAIVSVITRSGTNNLQGRVFAFHRDDSFDAQDPFSKAQGSGKAPFSQQRYGGFLGGPLIKDRFHYFASYERLREKSTSVITSSLVPADQREEPTTDMGHQYFGKVDRQLSSEHSLAVRYRADSRGSTGNGIGGLNSRERGNNTNTLDQDVVGSLTSVLRSNLLNEVRVQFARRSTFSDTEGYSVDGMPQINRPSGNLGKAQNMPQGRDENRYQVVDNFTYTRGAHDLKFGVDVSFIRADSFFPRNRDGNFTFSTDAPFNAADLSTYPTQYVVAILDPNKDLPNDLFSFFAQDQFRLRTNLTFNLGVRYDRERGFHKITGVPDDGNNFQPRLGFVWDPWNDGRTALRGGYGHYVDQSFLNIQLNVASAKDAVEIVINNPGYPDPYSRGTTAATPPSTATVTPHPKTPETRTASLGLKREVKTGLALSIDGVYSRGYNQYAWNDLNYPDPVTGVRPNPALGRVIEYADYGNSWYSALLVGVEQREFHGAAWNVSYTLSKTLRDVEGFQFTPQDMRNLAGDKSLASNHRQHQLVGNVTYRLPWGLQLGAVAQARSGLPWTVTTGTDNNRDSFIVDRPDLAVPDGNPTDRATYFSGFTGRVGNLGRNTNIGDGFFRLDARVSKIVRFGTRRLEGFVEGFNLTNQVNFGSPNGNLRSANFGRPTSITGTQRQVELGVRVDF